MLAFFLVAALVPDPLASAVSSGQFLAFLKLYPALRAYVV
jgi:hypothetical protein